MRLPRCLSPLSSKVKPAVGQCYSSELNVDNWNDNCEAKSEEKSPWLLRDLQVDFSPNVMFLIRGQIII